MTEPRALGNAAKVIVGGAADRVAESQRALFDAALLVFAGDKEAAAELLKTVSDNNNTVYQVLVLLRSGQVREAEDLLIDVKLKQLTRGSLNG